MAGAAECANALADLLDTDSYAPGADPRIVNAVCTLLESRVIEADEAAEEDDGEDTWSSGLRGFLGGADAAASAATTAAAAEASRRGAAARCKAGAECASAVLRGQRKLCIALFASPRLVPALLALLARPVVEHAERCQVAETLAIVVDIAGQPWAPPPPTPVVSIAVPERSMLTLRVILEAGDHRIGQFAAVAIVGYLSAGAPVTAVRFLAAGCGAALAAAAADADADAELAGAACDALRRIAGIDPDPAAVPGVVSIAVGACFRALAIERNTEAPANTNTQDGGEDPTDVTVTSAREYTIAVLLQVVVDGLARHHPDCAVYASAARTPSRLRSLAAALAAGAATPDALITTALVALGTDTLTALAADPLLLGPICQLVGPASAPSFAARLELDLDDPTGEGECVIDLANALSSLVPMVGRCRLTL